jgi:U3 small nucleolar RNA-associated protein 21
MDGTVRCWDIPSAQCLQAMRLGAPVTALSLSPSLDLLATCHADLRGIYLWSNQMMFGDPSQLAPSEQVRVRRAAGRPCCVSTPC